MGQISIKTCRLQHNLPAAVILIVLLYLLIQPAIAGAAAAPSASTQFTALANSNPLATTAGLFTAIFKVTGALAIVLGLLMLLVWWVRKLGLGKKLSHQGDIINILDTRMIAPKKFVSVLEVGGEYVVIGVTDTNINLLSRIENNEKLNSKLKLRQNSPTAVMPFAKSLSKALQNFSKKGQGKET